MNRSSGILSILIIALFLLPTQAGRFLIDLTGSIILVSLLIPLLLAGIGWVGWKIVASRMDKCEKCGARYQSSLLQCPLCGSIKNESSSNTEANFPASSATIDITAEEAD